MLAIILLTILILGTLEACDQALNETINHFKALDVLVNNAGVMFTDNLENFSEEHFDVSMNVNVKSALRLSQKSVEWLQASTVKSIVNVMRKWVLNCFYVIDNHIFLKEMVEDF